MEIPTAADATSRSPIRVSTLCLILGAVTIVCYLPGVGAPLVLDSLQLQNERHLQIVQPFGVALTQGPRSFVDWTFALNYQFGGGQPRGYSIVNIAIHVVNSLILFALARGTLKLPSVAPLYRARATELAFAIALLWAVHPLQTQAVTYVIQRYESLMATFFLLTMLLVLRGSQSQRSYVWYALAIVAGWVGMHCKEVMMTAPAVLVLYDRVFLASSWRELIARRGWLHAAMFVMAIFVLLGTRSAFDPSAEAAIGIGQDVVTMWEYFRTQPQVILHYIGLSLWPSRLTLDYVWLVADPWWEIYPAGVAVLALLAASFFALWRFPPLGFLGLGFFLILAPTSSILPIVDLAVEHRMYLPLAPLVALLIIAGYWAFNHLPQRFKQGRWAFVFSLAIVAALALRTFVRNREYANPLRLWTSTVAAAPHNSRARNFLAILLADVGRENDAEAHYQEAIRRQPRYPYPYNAYATLLKKQRRYAEAEKRLQTALALKPDFAEALSNYGSLIAARGDSAKAGELYRRATVAKPDYAIAWDNWGNLYARQGQYDEAIQKYQQALKADGNYSPALAHLGLAAFEGGQWSVAATAYERLVDRQPHDLAAQLKLAWLLAAAPDDSVRDPGRAVALAQQLVNQTRGENSEAVDVLAAAYASQGEFDKAIAAAQRAKQLAASQQDESALIALDERLEAYRLRQAYRLTPAASQPKGDALMLP